MLSFLSGSIRQKMLFMVFISVLPALGIILYSAFERQRLEVDYVKQDLNQTVMSAARIQLELTLSVYQVMATLSHTPAVQDCKINECSILFQHVQRLNPHFVNISLTDETGRMLASALPFDEVDLSERSHFKKAQETLKFSSGEVVISKLDPQPAFAFAHPLLDNGSFNGIIGLVVRLADYKGFFENIILPSGASFMILDQNGQYLFSSPASLEQLPGEYVDQELWQIIMGADSITSPAEVMYDNQLHLFAYKSLVIRDAELPYMHLVLKVPSDKALSETRARMMRDVALLFLAGIMGCLVAWFIGKLTIESKFLKLKSAADEIADGNLEARTNVSYSNGEIGDLARSFDTMAQTLAHNEQIRAISEQEQKKLQAQLYQAQKMESLGIMAGGIAHDFNNLLHIIQGHIWFLLNSDNIGKDEQSRLKMINESIERGSGLIGQMLTFSRMGAAHKKRLDVNRLLEDMSRMLERTLAKNIEIKSITKQDLWHAQADWAQMEQVLFNLAINAGDAMPNGGIISFETENIVVDEDYSKLHPATSPGRYIRIRVTDTGTGMDKKTAARIFDPFFTTKEPGKGTGLGLSTVYGIIKAHGGSVQCYSEPGRGTVFILMLPAAGEGDEQAVETFGEKQPLARGNETILVVDDEDDILELTREFLEDLGYVVLTAENGEKALDIYAQSYPEIQLVFLDMNMPGMGGLNCLKGILNINPDARIVICSGYAAGDQIKDAMDSGAAGFIGKPFQLRELSDMIRKTV